MSDRDLITNAELVQWLNRQDGWFVAGSSAVPGCASNDLDVVVHHVLLERAGDYTEPAHLYQILRCLI